MERGDCLITVIMSVHNGERFLREAVESILGQVPSDFEFLIVDDGSVDATPSILSLFAQQDHRVRILTNGRKRERCFSRNRAISEARGEFIAIMDADDISLPRRLEKQVEYLRSHPEVSVVSAWVESFDAKGELPPWKADRENISFDDIRETLPRENCYSHAVAMFRADVLKKYPYAEDQIVEDWDLWLRLVADGHRLGKMPEVLYRYRMHDSSTTAGWARENRFRRLFFECRYRFLEERRRQGKWGDFEKAVCSANARYLVEAFSLSALSEVLAAIPRKTGTKPYAEQPTRQIVLSYRRLHDGGIERFTATTANHFSRMGYEVIVVTAEQPHPNDHALLPSVKRKVLPVSSDEHIAWEQLFYRHQGAIYFISDELSGPVYKRMLFLKMLGGTVVAIGHNAWFTPLHPSVRLLEVHRTRIDIYRAIDAVVCPSAFDQAYYLWKGVPSVFHIPHTFAEDGPVTRAPLSEPNIVWAGRFSYEKDPEKMIDAFSLVHKRLPKSRLFMLGQGELTGSCRQRVRDLGLSDAVNFPGYVDAGSYLDKAAVHCLTSKFESFSLIWLEAKVRGVPTVLFGLDYLELARVPGHVSVEQGNVSALADALTEMLQDEGLRRRMGEDARVSAGEFSPERVLRAWRHLLDRLTEGSSCEGVAEIKLPAGELQRMLFGQMSWLGEESVLYINDILSNRWPSRFKRWIDVVFPVGTKRRRIFRDIYRYVAGHE